MHRVVGVVLVCAAAAHAEPHRRGAIVGVRVTDMTGDVTSDPYPSLALAADLELRRKGRLSVSIEPGIRMNGTVHYRMIYAGIPIVATFRHDLGADWGFRASAGVVPSLLAYGYLVSDAYGGGLDRTGITEHLRPWDVEAFAGAGIEHASHFVELRAARGLFTVHDDDPTLFAVHQELGLWFGVLR